MSSLKSFKYGTKIDYNCGNCQSKTCMFCWYTWCQVISDISLIVSWKEKWIAHRHYKYFIDFFAKKLINNARVSFLSCTSGMLSSQGAEILSKSDLINLQLIRINKTELYSHKELVRRKPSAPAQDTMIVACSWYNVL